MPQAGRWSCGLPLARPRDIADMPAVVDKQKPHCRFPGIARAALEISYDNGGIDADRTEAKLLRQLDRFLERCGIDSGYLPLIDTWLAGLTEAKIEELCTGSVKEGDAVLQTAPACTATLERKSVVSGKRMAVRGD